MVLKIIIIFFLNFKQENQKSKVLYIKDLNNQVTIQILYNLFGNFGNIAKILYIKQKNASLIEFSSIQDSGVALESLKNLPFYSKNLKVLLKFNYFY